jgi:hypothetical protein
MIVPGAGVLVMGLTGGCGPRVFEGPPPRLRAGTFLDASTVELTFSDPVAPRGEVDASQFRLSAAREYVADRTEDCQYGYYDGDYSYGDEEPCDAYPEYTRYYDAGTWAGSTLECDQYCPYSQETCCKPVGAGPPIPVVTTEITFTESGTIQLGVAPAIDAATCAAMDAIGDWPDSLSFAFYVHFDDAGGQVVNPEGVTLRPLGAHWVADPTDVRAMEGTLPDMRQVVPIACPAVPSGRAPARAVD